MPALGGDRLRCFVSGTGGGKEGARVNTPLTLTHPQAHALARLIRLQLDAYDEAVGSGNPRPEAEPLNGSELDLLEPLVALLEPENAAIC